MRPAQGRRARSKADAGVVAYAGKNGNAHHFTIEYPDRTTELVTLRVLRPRLVGTSAKQSAATAPAVVASAAHPLTLSTEGGARLALGTVMPGIHSAGKAGRLAALARAGGAGLHGATTEECIALAEVVDVSSALSIFAPWGANEQAAAWMRQQGCVLRRGNRATGPEAAQAPELLKARRNGVDLGFVWIEADEAVTDLVLSDTAACAREGAVARVSHEYVSSGDGARLTWLRARQAEGRLFLIPCATCIWVVLLAVGKRRQDFLRGAVPPLPVF